MNVTHYSAFSQLDILTAYWIDFSFAIFVYWNLSKELVCLTHSIELIVPLSPFILLDAMIE